MVAYDASGELFGVISLSVARSRDAIDHYTTSDLRTFGCLRMLEQARPAGQTLLNTCDPRVRLICELQSQTFGGQDRCLRYPYRVLNGLLLWYEIHGDELSIMARNLLEWAVDLTEIDGLPIWTQIPVDEKPLFLGAGFAEVRRFTLNLNHYRPQGSREDWGTQEWVQMVYFRQRR